MSRRKMTDAQLAARTPEQQKEVLKKRRQREAKDAAAAAERRKVIDFPSGPVAPAAPLPEAPPGIDPGDERARAMYDTLKRKMQAAGLWNDEAAHGPLMLYCKSVVAVEASSDVRELPAAVMVQVSKLHAQLKLDSLPAERVRKESKFGGNWG